MRRKLITGVVFIVSILFAAKMANGDEGFHDEVENHGEELLTPGLIAEFFAFRPGNIFSVDSIATATSAFVRVDSAINYRATNGPWPGLDAALFTDNFASRHTGFLRISESGYYVFYLTSDDGSRLFIDDCCLIDNDGIHGTTELSAEVWLSKGDHPICVEYFDSGFVAELCISWAGSNFEKEVIPESVFFHPNSEGCWPLGVAVASPVQGLVFGIGHTVHVSAVAGTVHNSIALLELYAGTNLIGRTQGVAISLDYELTSVGPIVFTAFAVDTSGCFSYSAPVEIQVVEAPIGYVYGVESSFYSYDSSMPGLPADYADGLFSFPVLDHAFLITNRVDNQIEFPETYSAWTGLPEFLADRFASVHETNIKIDVSGRYTFYLRSDDGSRLWLDDEKIIDNDGAHGMTELSCSIDLICGIHPLCVEYFENGGCSGLSLMWEGPGFSKRIVEPTVLLRRSGIVDSDGDGLPDWYELKYGLDPLNAASAETDTDSDGIPDLREYLESGSNPVNADTDGDGLPDGWEFFHGLNPLDPGDCYVDSDGDGLINCMEYDLGTHPRRVDTDGDGLIDDEEVSLFMSDPLVANGCVTREVVFDSTGVEGLVKTGEWTADGDVLFCETRSGDLSFSFDSVAESFYRIVIHAEKSAPVEESSDFVLSVCVNDGNQIIVPCHAESNDGLIGRLSVGPLKEGRHSICVSLRNEGRPSMKGICRVVVERFNFCAAENLVNACIDNLLNVVIPQTSFVSPICVEGKGALEDVLIGSDFLDAARALPEIVKLPHCGWYADIDLSPTNVTSIVFGHRAVSHYITNRVEWISADLLNLPTNLVLRVDDALMFTVGTNGIFGTNDVMVGYRESGADVCIRFDESRTNCVRRFKCAGCATFLLYGMTVDGTNGFVEVSTRVLGGSLCGPISLPLGEPRVWRTTLASDVFIETDTSLEVEQIEQTGRMNAILNFPSRAYLAVRTQPDGVVLDASYVDLFAMEPLSRSGYLDECQTLEDGTRVCEGRVVLTGVAPRMVVRLTMLVGGNYFEKGVFVNGRSVVELTPRDFDSNGVCRFRMYFPAGTANYCYHLEILQNGEDLL